MAIRAAGRIRGADEFCWHRQLDEQGEARRLRDEFFNRLSKINTNIIVIFTLCIIIIIVDSPSPRRLRDK